MHLNGQIIGQEIVVTGKSGGQGQSCGQADSFSKAVDDFCWISIFVIGTGLPTTLDVRLFDLGDRDVVVIVRYFGLNWLVELTFLTAIDGWVACTRCIFAIFFGY